MGPKVMPAELMNELYDSMPFGNAFCLLAKMPNGLLARNIQKMIKSIREAMRNNKLNGEDCGPNLEIFEDGHATKHSGQDDEPNIIRAVLPIPSLNLKIINGKIIASYFEIEILNKIGANSIEIGFCEKQFTLEREWLGCKNNSNSIGIDRKEQIHIDGSNTYFENKNDDDFFKKGDFVGIGIINQPNSQIECFATWNGKLLGKHALPPNFENLALFPAFTLAIAGESIRVNFGKELWKFKEFGLILE